MLNYRYNLKALIDALEQSGELDIFVRDIFRFNLLCAENYGVKEILFDEHVAAESKTEYFNRNFAADFSENFKRFVLLLITNNDLSAYELMNRKFVELVGQERNSAFVEVLSAVALSPEQQEALKQETERLLGGKVYLYNVISPEVIGGFILKCGGKMLDFSVQAALSELKTVLV